MTKITFLTVDNNNAKLSAIVQTVQQQLDQGKRILITVPSDEAAAYIDKLLWSMPEESFSPHVIASATSQECVVITTQAANHNKAEVLINLQPTICPISSEFDTVFDLYDATHPDKEQLSIERKDAYQALGFVANR